MVAYSYDAWGKCTVTSGASNAIANANPIRYRDYYYDTDTGFYYLQSRYYDPTVKRFISADDTDYLGANGDFISLNLYAYCLNNPMSHADQEGTIAITIGIMLVGGIIGSVISAASSAITQKALTGSVDGASVAISAVAGCASGAIAASPLGIVGQRIAGGIIGGLSYVADCYFHDKAMKLDEAIVSVGMGVISGQIGGPGANEHMALTNVIKSTKTVMAREARRANRQYAQKAIMSAIRYRNNTISVSSWSSSFLFSTGTGISNAVTGAYSELDWLPNFLSYKPW